MAEQRWSEQRWERVAKESDDERTNLIAPLWHTVALLTFYIALACIGPTSMRSRSQMPHAMLYVYMMMYCGMQLSLAVSGVYERDRFFFETLMQRARSWRVDLLRGVAVYMGSVLLFVIYYICLRHSGIHVIFDTQAMHAMTPSNALELLLWLGVTASVAFNEEHVFRGYLLKQTMAWVSRALSPRLSVVASVLCTSLLFGVLHLYEGGGGAAYIGMLGMMYAVCALRFGNLRAVMVAHILQDFVGSAVRLLRHA